MKTGNSKEDIKLAVKGDSEAFSRLYALIYKDLYRSALYNLRSETDACDVVSETILDAFSSIKNLRNEDAFKSWIFKILFAKIKRKQKEYMNANEDIDEPVYENLLNSMFDYDHIELAEAMYSISDEERMILSLSVLGGYSSDEISDILSIKSATIRSKLSRTKDKLRKFIEDRKENSNG